MCLGARRDPCTIAPTVPTGLHLSYSTTRKFYIYFRGMGNWELGIGNCTLGIGPTSIVNEVHKHRALGKLSALSLACGKGFAQQLSLREELAPRVPLSARGKVPNFLLFSRSRSVCASLESLSGARKPYG